MGGGCGPVPNDVELSVARGYLAATTLTCPDGKQVALFGGGIGNGEYFSNDVDIFDCDFNNISETALSQPLFALAATTLTCPDGKQFALFGGGQVNFFPSGYSNDVDVFACCDTTCDIQFLNKIYLSQPRSGLAATTLTCPDGKQFALFGGGFGNNYGYSNDVDVFACCDTTCDIQFLNKIYLSQPRSDLAATTLTCPDGKQFALFGGGFISGGSNLSNNVDVFVCCDTSCDVQLLNTIYLSQPRSHLAATTLTCPDGKQFALFGGGSDNINNGFSNVDVFACCDETCDVQLLYTINLSEPRGFLAATTLTCPNGKQFALFGGGFDDNSTSNNAYSKVVDVFACCDTTCDVQLLNTIYLSHPRSDLVAITMNDCCNREVALFGGGYGGGGDNYFNDVDIFDCDDILG